jgi:hypothetical protein
LLLLNEGRGAEEILTGKLLEYLNHRIPILALIPRASEAARLVDRTKAGVVVAPQNVKETKKALYRYYCQYKKGSLQGSVIGGRFLEPYSRIELTRKLALQLDSMLSGAAAGASMNISRSSEA